MARARFGGGGRTSGASASTRCRGVPSRRPDVLRRLGEPAPCQVIVGAEYGRAPVEIDCRVEVTRAGGDARFAPETRAELEARPRAVRERRIRRDVVLGFACRRRFALAEARRQVDPHVAAERVRPLRDPEHARGEVRDDGMGRYHGVERVPVAERKRRTAAAGAIAQDGGRGARGDAAAVPRHELVHAGVARDRRRELADAGVLGVGVQGCRAVVVGEHGRGRVADDTERTTGARSTTADSPALPSARSRMWTPSARRGR